MLARCALLALALALSSALAGDAPFNSWTTAIQRIWDGGGTTRNLQWLVVGREIPGEDRNGGLVFGELRILAEVDDSGETNLKTGIGMLRFFGREGRTFVCCNVNKEHILPDEIPAAILDEMTPG